MRVAGVAAKVHGKADVSKDSKTKSAIERAEGRRSGRNRAGKNDQLVGLLKRRSESNIDALSCKLGWQHQFRRARHHRRSGGPDTPSKTL